MLLPWASAILLEEKGALLFARCSKNPQGNTSLQLLTEQVAGAETKESNVEDKTLMELFLEPNGIT